MVKPLIPPGIENRSAFGPVSPGFLGVLILENHTLMDILFLVFLLVAFLYGTQIIPRGSLDQIAGPLKILFSAYAILVTTRYPRVVLEKTIKKYVNLLHKQGVLAYNAEKEGIKQAVDEVTEDTLQQLEMLSNEPIYSNPPSKKSTGKI
tara:strand:+ start:150 stop:596 length:447 start_codon:yes stop_codon:yes gene_type:complete